MCQPFISVRIPRSMKSTCSVCSTFQNNNNNNSNSNSNSNSNNNNNNNNHSHSGADPHTPSAGIHPSARIHSLLGEFTKLLELA